MKRFALLPFLILAGTSFATTPQEILAKRYKEFGAIKLKGDSKAITAWLQTNCTSNFSYTTYQKNKFTRDGYLNRILVQIAKTNKVLKSNTVVREIQVKSGTMVATVASEFKGVVSFDSKKLTLTDQGVSFDTWVLIGKDWKLSKIVQVNADTQMQQEGD